MARNLLPTVTRCPKLFEINFKVELSEDERKYFLVANVVNALDAMHDFEKLNMDL
jgi:hypothetical protein